MAFRARSSAPTFGRRRVLTAVVGLAVAATGAGRLRAHDSTPTPAPTASATPPTSAAGQSDATPVASPQASPVASGPVVEVSMNALKYLPAEISIHAGTTVVWTNDDVVAHTVTQRVSPADRELHSPMMLPGESFAFTFDRPGSYPYFCEPHPFMTGRVTVS